LKSLRIGTRSSALALWQANRVREELARLRGVEAELVPIRTLGDRLQSASAAETNEAIGAEGGKGIFIKEIEDALLSGAVDIAVHSMKDVPTEIPRGLAFPAITKREDPRDCLISREGRALKDLSAGATVGTGSLRRQAQLRRYRPDLQVLGMRGNVDTRLKKVAAGEFDAIVLAVAGITRLGASHRITEILSSEVMLPAAGQGALGIETRADDRDTSALAASLDDAETHACVVAERALLRELEGGCQVPLGAWARMEKDSEIFLEACVLSPDGVQFVRGDERGAAADAEAVGENLAAMLVAAGADKILRLAGRSVGQS
jgi:hydroxymethylbilane synthase